MTFPRIRAPGLWVLGSVIAPAEEEAFDDHQSKAVDGYGGGAYAPLDRLVFGGAGVDFTGGTGTDPLGPLTSVAALGTNASGIYAEGDGTGGGGYFVGGGSSGDGATGITQDGAALFGHATGTGMALNCNADGPAIAAAEIVSGNDKPGLLLYSSLGNALEAFGGAAGAGAVLTGGSTSGPGGIATGGGPDGHGFVANGTGDGAGLYATSLGTLPGVLGIAGGGGDGGKFIASSGNGRGVYGAGFGSGAGGYFLASSAAGIGVDIPTGSLRLPTNTATPSTATGDNQLWAGLITKATGVVATDGVGGITVLDGVNFDAVISGSGSPGGSRIDVALTTHMASDNYYVGVEMTLTGSMGTYVFMPNVFNKAVDGFSFSAINVQIPPSYVGVAPTIFTTDFTSLAITISLIVVGRQ